MYTACKPCLVYLVVQFSVYAGQSFHSSFSVVLGQQQVEEEVEEGLLPHPLDQEVGEVEEVQGGLHLGPESGSNLDK